MTRSGSKKIYVNLAVFLIFVLSPFVGVPVYPQVVGATLAGTVTDSSGLLIPNVSISITNLGTGVTRNVTSDAAGFYSAPNLLPGTYEISTSAPGFSTEVRTGITLTVGAQQTLNFTMRVGRVTEKVQVAGEAPAVQLATSTVSEEVNATTVRELPLNGRSWTDLATLQPGINAIENQQPFTNGDRGKRGFGQQLTISGQKPVQNNYRLDGISINDYGNAGPGSVLGVNLGVDAVQEFSVLSSNYSAEYGRSTGGVVNAITKSGTNQFHGSAYEFLRNSALDARNFFDYIPAPGRTPPFRRNQFGVSGGGPIRKDRTFVFADYEGIRQAKGVAVVDDVPSAAARAGNLCSVPGSPPVCTPHTVIPDPSAVKYLPLFPLPNGSLDPGGDSGLFTTAQSQSVKENYLTTRIDHKISGKDSLFGSFLYDDTPFTAPDIFNNVVLGSHTNRDIVVLEETHIFSPRLVNSIRAGYNRDGVTDLAAVSGINPVAKDTSLGVLPGHTAGDVAIGGGITELPGGVGSVDHVEWYWTSWQAYDDAFLTLGSHSLKFGGNVERIEDNNISYGQHNGAWQFADFQSFLTNQPATYKFDESSEMAGFRQTLVGGYFQDDWRWRPNVTLNLGLRYEMVTVLSEEYKRLSWIDSMTDATIHLGSSSPLMPNPTLRNFEPRVGFSWDPFKKGTTAVRGGFGVFDALPLPWQFSGRLQGAYPFSSSGTAQGSELNGLFFQGANPLLAAQGSTSQGVVYIDQNPHRNYVMGWNLNVQEELSPSLTAMIGYVGSRTVHADFGPDSANDVLPKNTPQGLFWPNPHGSGMVLNPNWGKIAQRIYSGRASYDGLETAIMKRMSHGLQIQASFTWGKSMDNTSNLVAGDAFQNSIPSMEWFNLSLPRGLSDFDIGRTLVINGIWQVPEWKSAPGFAGWITNGWELGAIFKANDGFPFTATLGTDGDPLGKNSADNWDFPNRLTGPGCSSAVNPGNPNTYIKTQCFAVPTVAYAGASAALCDTTIGQSGQCLNLRGNSGRNIMIGPGIENLDFSIFKNNHIRRISENFNVQFRAEFFNILNRANFNAPALPGQTDIFNSVGLANPTAGLITSTVTDPREIQFALKLVW